MRIFSVYDSKVGSYSIPLCFKNAGEAIRWFTEMIMDSKTKFSKYPEDFTLFEIGEFSEETGIVVPHKAHMSRGLALDYVRPDVNTGVDRVRAL